MMSFAAGGNHLGIINSDQRLRISHDRVGPPRKLAPEGGPLHGFVLQRPVREQQDRRSRGECHITGALVHQKAAILSAAMGSSKESCLLDDPIGYWHSPNRNNNENPRNG
jgi:hypothetical protein